MPSRFHVGITRDFLDDDGEIVFPDIGLSMFDGQDGISWAFLDEDTSELSADQVADCDGLLVLSPKVTAATLRDADRRLQIVARFGVGYDTVDVGACTRQGVAVSITPDGVRRPMATAMLTLVLALSHRLIERDRMTRAGRWEQRRDVVGTGLTGRVLGIIGLGNIGQEFSRLARPLEMRHLAFDPYVDPATAAAVGADLVGLDEVVAAADLLCVACPLTDDTRHLIDERRLGLMKPTACLVNAARGPIVDQRALVEALVDGTICAAGLDVYEEEPPRPDDPLLRLDNVIVTPHSLCWSDECFRLNGESACRSILEMAYGQGPAHLVNPEVLDSPVLQRKRAASPVDGGTVPAGDRRD